MQKGEMRKVLLKSMGGYIKWQERKCGLESGAV